MENKGKSLSNFELENARSLKSPIIDLILINGWRRFEVAQAALNYVFPMEMVQIRFKHRKRPESVILTQKEKELLQRAKTEVFGTHKPTITNYKKIINRHFDKFKSVGEWLNDDIFTHRFRATAGTKMSELGVPIKTISKALNHSSTKITEGYIQPSNNEILAAKELMNELVTYDGLTPQELLAEIYKKQQRIQLLEKEIERMRNA